jgi:hypothetical protein
MNVTMQCHTRRVLTLLTSLLGMALVTGCLHVGGATGAKPVASRLTIPSVIVAPATSSPLSGSPMFVALGALGKLKDATGVHIEITSTAASGATTTVTDDATDIGGRQRFEAMGATMTILFTGDVAYAEGNEAGLVGFLGIPDAKARSAAFRWIAFDPGDKVGVTTYADLTNGITASSVASELTLAAPYAKIPPATIDGQPSVGIRARVPATEKVPASARVSLYVSKADGRPVFYKLAGDGAHKYQVTFSKWGEAVNLTAPDNVVAAASL